MKYFRIPPPVRRHDKTDLAAEIARLNTFTIWGFVTVGVACYWGGWLCCAIWNHLY